MMPDVVLRQVLADGSYGAALSGWQQVDIAGEDGRQLTLTVQIPTDHPQYDLLQPESVWAALIDVAGQQVEPPDWRFQLDEAADDEVAEGEAATWKGSSQLFRMSDALVFPQGYPDLTVKGTQFNAATPGYAFRQLFEKAQARGCLAGWTLGFDDGFDSSGAAWGTTTSELVEMGKTLLDVLSMWADRKWVSARATGNKVLQLYAWGNQGDDLTSAVTLRRAYHLQDGPRSISTRDNKSAILAISDQPDVGPVVVTDASAETRLGGRREGFLTQSQVLDTAALQNIADGTLALTMRSRDAFTYGLNVAGDANLPFVHFDRGDLVTVIVDGAEREQRVRQLGVTWLSNGDRSGFAAFGAYAKTPDEVVEDRIKQLTGGSLDGGLYQAPMVVGGSIASSGGGGSDPKRDTVPPSPPTALARNNVAYVISNGFMRAVATLTWAAPTTNVDGTALQDLGYYQLQYKEDWWDAWQPGGTAPGDATNASIPLDPRKTYDVRIRALDTWANASSWATLTLTTDADPQAPVHAPSTPRVSAVLFSALKVGWDGLDDAAAQPESDVWYAEVHLSTTSGFTPNSGTLVQTIAKPAAGQLSETILTDLTAGTTYYVKLRSKDAWGNVSPASAQASGTPLDVFSSKVGPEDLAFSDFGNLVPDGSFERAETRAALTDSGALQQGPDGVNWSASAQWSWVQNTGQHVVLHVPCTATSQWKVRAGSAAPTGVDADGVFKDGGTGVRWASVTDVPFDPNALYQVLARVRVDRDSTNGLKGLYVGVEGKDSSGAPTNTKGLTDWSDAQYAGAMNRPQAQVDGWRTMGGWFQGTAATPVTQAEGTLDAPVKLAAGASRMALQVLMDWSNGDGRWRVGHASITGVPSSVHGAWSLQVAGSSVKWTRAVLATLPAAGGAEQWYVKFRVRLVGPRTTTPTAFAGIRLLSDDGSVIPTTAIPLRNSWAHDGWYVVEGRISRQADMKFAVAGNAELFIGSLDLAAGQSFQFDAVEFRQVATNVLIADAAIDNAKIKDLSVSKLTAGTLSAVVTISGTIQTASSGARSVMNSSGLNLYNSDGDNTVQLNAADGSAKFSGTIGSVDIVGYARVINPVTSSQMYMHPGFNGDRYPLIAADTGLLTPTWPGMLRLNAGQLVSDQTWTLTTPRVSWANTADPTTQYEIGQMTLALLSNTIMNTTDKTLWPTRMGGSFRVVLPYGTTTTVSGYTIVTRPFFEFMHDIRQPETPLAAGDGSLAGYSGFWMGNKWGHDVGFMVDPDGVNPVNVNVSVMKQKMTAFAGMKAAAFTISSHSSTKTDVADPEYSALEVVLANPAQLWRYKKDPSRLRLGPMADDLPHEVSVDGRHFDATSAIGLLWKALDELTREVRGG